MIEGTNIRLYTECEDRHLTKCAPGKQVDEPNDIACPLHELVKKRFKCHVVDAGKCNVGTQAVNNQE